MNLQDTKKAAWEQLVKTKPRPPVLTDHRLEKLKQEVWEDQHFWWDLLIRHDLRDKLLSELDESIRLHAIGNFWGMLCQTYYQEKTKGRR